MATAERGSKHTKDEKIGYVKTYREGVSAKTVGQRAGVNENTILRWHRALEAAEKRVLQQQRRRGYIGHRPATREVKEKIADPDVHASFHLGVSERLAYIERFLATVCPEQWKKTIQ